MKLTAVKPRPLFSLASVGTQAGMLRYSSVPISAPLTTLVPGGGATNAPPSGDIWISAPPGNNGTAMQLAKHLSKRFRETLPCLH